LVCASAELLIGARFAGVIQPGMSTRLLLRSIQICKQAGSGASRETLMLWTVFAILLLLWLLGWGFHVAGSLIHLILVIALVVLLVEVITGRRAAI
jgi:hypothetical protein